MVSRLTPQLTIELDSYKHQLVLNDFNGVANSVVINWGRSSFYQAPMNRTCSITFVHWADWALPADYLYSILRVRYRDTLLFEGHVDRATLRDRVIDGSHKNVLEINAVEAPSFYKDLQNTLTFWPTSRNDFENRFDNAGLNPKHRRLIGSGRGDEDPAYVRDTPREWTLYDALSTAQMTFPLSFPVWMPGFKYVYTTRWNPLVFSKGVISDEHMVINSIESSADEHRQSIWVETDANAAVQYGWEANRRRGVTGVQGDYKDFQHRYLQYVVQQQIPTVEYSGHDYAVDLVALQRSNPLTVTVVDDTQLHSAPPSIDLFWTWEDPDRSWTLKLTNASEPFRKQLKGATLAPIGGRLRFTHERTTHDLSLIYCA
mgnify:CR=1 FL=1